LVSEFKENKKNTAGGDKPKTRYDFVKRINVIKKTKETPPTSHKLYCKNVTPQIAKIITLLSNKQFHKAQ
jgi:hypothetical protein